MLSFCNEELLTLLSAALTSKHVDRFYFESLEYNPSVNIRGGGFKEAGDSNRQNSSVSSH
jgi:hypothetical protein